MTSKMDAVFHHVAICVADIEKATRFYCDILGFDVLWDAPDRAGEELSRVVGLAKAKAHITMLTGYGAHVELFTYHNPEGKKPAVKPQCDCGITHFALSVQGIDTLYTRMKEQGVRFNCPPQNIRPGVWVTYFQDCEGNTIEFVQYPK